jgi:uncharacterized membrane protein
MTMSEGGTRHRNIWLILSLCLNVLLIAMIAVGMARVWHRHHEDAMGPAFSAESIVGHLPPDRAARVQAIIDRHAAAMKRLRDNATVARLRARPIFTAPRFDAAAYARAQQNLRAADDALQVERLKQLAEIAAILSAQERADIVARARDHDRHEHRGRR